MTWRVGQLVRVLRRYRQPTAGVVVRILPTQVVLRDGSRWQRSTGLLFGVGPTTDRIEDWGDEHRRAG